MHYWDYVKLILAHTATARAMALLFFAGTLCAVPVMRYRIRPLLATPAWFAKVLERIMAGRPSVARLATFIFLFNGPAIFLYMLTGLVPWLPALVVFTAGMNVVLAGLISSRDGGATHIGRPLSTGARVCGVLTFLLELPSLWYAMAMGWTLQTPVWSLLQGADIAPLRIRVAAYMAVILPVLAVSAVAEAYAVTRARA